MAPALGQSCFVSRAHMPPSAQGTRHQGLIWFSVFAPQDWPSEPGPRWTWIVMVTSILVFPQIFPTGPVFPTRPLPAHLECVFSWRIGTSTVSRLAGAPGKYKRYSQALGSYAYTSSAWHTQEFYPRTPQCKNKNHKYAYGYKGILGKYFSLGLVWAKDCW